MEIQNPMVTPIIAVGLLGLGVDITLTRMKHGERVEWQVQAHWCIGPWSRSRKIYERG